MYHTIEGVHFLRQQLLIIAPSFAYDRRTDVFLALRWRKQRTFLIPSAARRSLQLLSNNLCLLRH